jgi:hypothetical protein
MSQEYIPFQIASGVGATVGNNKTKLSVARVGGPGDLAQLVEGDQVNGIKLPVGTVIRTDNTVWINHVRGLELELQLRIAGTAIESKK